MNNKKTIVLVGIAGSANAFSLSLYNLKAYAYTNASITKNYEIKVIQHPLINEAANLAAATSKLEALTESISSLNPYLVGFSCYMWNINSFKKIALSLRKKFHSIYIVGGGPEIATDYIEQGKYNDFEIDFCISGEGELTFAELLTCLSNASPQYHQIPGLSYRNGTDFHINPKREAFKSLSEIPSPYLNDIVDLEVITRLNIEANLETQRGCSLRCSYCIYHKDMNRISYNIISRVIAEVKWVCSYKVKNIRFVDANFSSDLDHAKNVMRALINEKIEARLMFELIPGFIDEELASLFDLYNKLHSWNKITLGIGVQTINHDILKKLRRGIRIDKFESTFNLLEKYEIYAKIDLIIGLPGEDIASIEKTLEYFLERLKNSQAHLLCCHLMRGLPGTELLEIAKKHQMVFSSKREPHEFIESPILPRAHLIKSLRRTGVIFRLVNHKGWASHEFLLKTEHTDTCIRDQYFKVKDKLNLKNIELIDKIVEKLHTHLENRNSYFVDEDFPFAETWWWNLSKIEISNKWLIETLNEIGETV